MSLSRIRRQWEALGAADPLWAVLSDPAKRGNRWDVEEFFRTGREEVRATLAWLAELGVAPRGGAALDFGCGVGRLTQALAGHFDEVHGVDVAASMVALARRYDRHGGRCSFHVNTSDRLPFEDGRFSLVLSLVTLQHIPPAVAARYIVEFVRVLAPGGVVCFQEPSDPLPLPGDDRTWPLIRRRLRDLLPEAAVSLARSARRALTRRTVFEMHGIPRQEVEALLGGAGARVVAVRSDDAAGEGWTSFRYVAVR